MKYLSRDRGKQYQNLSANYIHIADRFHIIKNISDNLIKALQKIIPLKCKVEDYHGNIIDDNISAKLLDESFCNKEKTIAHKNKIVLIKQVKEEYKKNKSIRKTARIFKMNRKTIAKYISMKNIEEEGGYNISARKSILDTYKDIILQKFCECKKVTEVHKYLSEKGINSKYSTLNNYIKKNISNNPAIVNKMIDKKTIIINRKDIINEIFNWKNKDDSVKKHIKELKKQYPIIRKYQSFYKKFKDALTSLDVKTIIKIFDTDYNDISINSFLQNAKNDDYIAILNSAKYEMNNGILEGTVNKIKTIKKTMYGRCSVELLAAKVIYQSNNYL